MWLFLIVNITILLDPQLVESEDAEPHGSTTEVPHGSTTDPKQRADYMQIFNLVEGRCP